MSTNTGGLLNHFGRDWRQSFLISREPAARNLCCFNHTAGQSVLALLLEALKLRQQKAKECKINEAGDQCGQCRAGEEKSEAKMTLGGSIKFHNFEDATEGDRRSCGKLKFIFQWLRKFMTLYNGKCCRRAVWGRGRWAFVVFSLLLDRTATTFLTSAGFFLSPDLEMHTMPCWFQRN